MEHVEHALLVTLITPLYIDVTCTLTCQLPEDREELQNNFTYSAKKKTHRKIHAFHRKCRIVLAVFQYFFSEVCICWLFNRRRQPPFPYLGSAGPDRKSAGEIIGQKCAGLLDLAY